MSKGNETPAPRLHRARGSGAGARNALRPDALKLTRRQSLAPRCLHDWLIRCHRRFADLVRADNAGVPPCAEPPRTGLRGPRRRCRTCSRSACVDSVTHQYQSQSCWEAQAVHDTDESTGRLLLDSNIWIKEVGLMSKRASTLRLYMQDRRKRLVVPEVVQAEAARHLADRMRSQAAAGRKAHEQLLRMVGRLSEWRIPSDEEIAERAERLARGMDVPADYIELQPDTALRGARRCLAARGETPRRTENGGAPG